MVRSPIFAALGLTAMALMVPNVIALLGVVLLAGRPTVIGVSVRNVSVRHEALLSRTEV